MNDIPEREHEKIQPDESDPEVKKANVRATTSAENISVLNRFEHFSNWSSLVRAVTMIQRLIARKKCKHATQAPVCEEDKQRAESTIIKLVQHEAFDQEIKSLKTKEINSAGKKRSNNSLHKFDPFVDDQEMLRVGGRLKASSLHFTVKHPLILPKKSHVTNLIIKHLHENTAHQGRGLTANALRSRGYWVIGCSAVVSSLIFKCVTCRKLRGQKQGQKMADLPEDRLEPSPPFTYCGADCFGPFIVKEKRKELKKYGLLFTCMASRAVHIELLDDMSTDAFLNSLRCFMALRGQVRQIRCDRGTNFVGAKHELQQALSELDEETVRARLLEKDCDFIMNAPLSSHMGGVWEQQIRSIRSVLTALLDQSGTCLDGSSLRTFLYEAMTVVNSRPLATENLYDPLGPTPLTPNQLLTMKSEIALPPPGSFMKEDLYARKRWRRVQHLAKNFGCDGSENI